MITMLMVAMTMIITMATKGVVTHVEKMKLMMV